jgi:protein O-mannosyl-transferase
MQPPNSANADRATRKPLAPHLLLLFALACTFAAYSGTLKFQFVHDDRGQIVENPAIHAWCYVPQYFTRQVWAGVYPEELGNYYRPLFLLWLRINDAVFGDHAWGWHLTTLLTHLVVIVLVYFLTFHILQDGWSAGLTAVIFGLHPVHIEAVAWVSGVTEPLLGMLLTASFLCYLKGRRQVQKRRVWKALSLILFVLAILEKETALIEPALIFAYEWLYGTQLSASLAESELQRFKRALWPTTPYCILILPYLVARDNALKGLSHDVASLPISAVLLTWPSLMWFWIEHLVWPVGLSTFYDLSAVSHANFQNFVLPAVGVIAVASILLYWTRRSRETAFAAAWLVLPLIPLLNIRVFLQNDFAHDRYLYLPSVGFAIVAASAVRRLRLGQAKLLGKPAIQIASIMGLTALLGFGTQHEAAYFRNNVVFYQHNVRTSPNNVYAKINFAVVLGEQGKYEEAIQLLNQALEIDSKSWPANYNLGYTYYKIGLLESAEKYFLRAVQINPNKADEFFYLGLTQFRMDRPNEAATTIRHAILIRPDGYGYHFALGVILKTQGDLSGALEQFREEVKVSPLQSAARQQMAEIEGSFARKPSNGSSPRQ